MDKAIKKKIEALLSSNKVFLFMKGHPDGHMCGYSSRVVQILKDLKVGFSTYNVIEDPIMWEAIKEYSNWPTIPQLYVEGKLVGGCDITTELATSGKLPKILGI